MKLLIVIPARFGSTRFPGKPLASIAGVSLIERVHRNCSRVKGAKVVVATDDRRIAAHVRAFGGEAMMTSRRHPSGTDRAAEVARRHACEVVINVQGDEPLLPPAVIRQLAAAMRDPGIEMATLCHGITSQKDYMDPNVVKLVTDRAGNALYFSRSPIPHIRDRGRAPLRPGQAFRHLGIYAYRRRFLLHYVKWPQSPLEKAEKLEQLRALERGVRIHVLKTNYKAIGVDVPSDVKKVEKLLKKSR
jgi:3-deoxy-manno-octulosonate cytidylyltransferase (CMP-KDO synthetase)